MRAFFGHLRENNKEKTALIYSFLNFCVNVLCVQQNCHAKARKRTQKTQV